MLLKERFAVFVRIAAEVESASKKRFEAACGEKTKRLGMERARNGFIVEAAGARTLKGQNLPRASWRGKTTLPANGKNE